MKLSDDASLVCRSGYTELRSRLGSILTVVDDESRNLKAADAAEMELVEELRRRIGHVSLQTWASGQMIKTPESVAQADRKNASIS